MIAEFDEEVGRFVEEDLGKESARGTEVIKLGPRFEGEDLGCRDRAPLRLWRGKGA